jgi:hypothetical protein
MRSTGFTIIVLFCSFLLLVSCSSTKSKVVFVDGKRYDINDLIALQSEIINPSITPTVHTELSNQFLKRNLQTNEELEKLMDMTEQFLVKLEDNYDVYKTRHKVEEILTLDAPSQNGKLLVYIPHQSYAFLANYRIALKVAALPGV